MVFDGGVSLPDDRNQVQLEAGAKWWSPCAKAEQYKFLLVTEMKSISTDGLGIHDDEKKDIFLWTLGAVRVLNSRRKGVDAFGHTVERVKESLDESRGIWDASGVNVHFLEAVRGVLKHLLEFESAICIPGLLDLCEESTSSWGGSNR